MAPRRAAEGDEAQASFSLSCGFIAVLPNRCVGLGDEFRTAALDQIAGLGNKAFQEFQNIAQTGIAIDDFGDRLTPCRVRLDLSGGAQRAGRYLELHCVWRHAYDAAPVRCQKQGAYRAGLRLGNWMPSSGRCVVESRTRTSAPRSNFCASSTP